MGFLELGVIALGDLYMLANVKSLIRLRLGMQLAFSNSFRMKSMWMNQEECSRQLELLTSYCITIYGNSQLAPKILVYKFTNKQIQ